MTLLNAEPHWSSLAVAFNRIFQLTSPSYAHETMGAKRIDAVPFYLSSIWSQCGRKASPENTRAPAPLARVFKKGRASPLLEPRGLHGLYPQR